MGTLWGPLTTSDNRVDFLEEAEGNGTATSTLSSYWRTRRLPLPVGFPGLEFTFLYPLPNTEPAYWLLISVYKKKGPNCSPVLLLVELARGRGLPHQESPHNWWAAKLACALRSGAGETMYFRQKFMTGRHLETILSHSFIYKKGLKSPETFSRLKQSLESSIQMP